MRKRNYFGGKDLPYCSGAEGADERGRGRGRERGEMKNREIRKWRGLWKTNVL